MDTYRGGGHMKTEGLGVMLPQAKEAWSHQKLQEARRDCPLEHPGGAQACWQPNFWQKCEKISFCFKPSSLCSFVTAATGN